MKIALVLITAGLCMLPLQNAQATYDVVNAIDSSSKYKQKQKRPSEGRSAGQDLKVRSRQQATQMIKGQYKAKVLSVLTARVNGNPGYKAKLLSRDGVVFYVYIDATTGKTKRP
jgi:uncharacterized membrane protein YkoI